MTVEPITLTTVEAATRHAAKRTHPGAFCVSSLVGGPDAGTLPLTRDA